MRLRRFRVQGFAQFEDVEITFRDDAPNLIIGPNEAGKSHLMQAFYGMFFGVPQAERFVPWHGTRIMRGELEFADQDGKLVRLERDLASTAVTVTVDGEEPWTGRVSGHATDALRFPTCLDQWLGFRDKDVFCSTTFVQQADVIHADMRGVAPEVRRLITGTVEADYERVKTDLVKDLDRLRKKPTGHKPRELELKRVELAQLKEEFYSASQRQADFAKLQKEHDEIQAALDEKTRQLQEGEKRLELARDLVDSEGELTDHEDTFRELWEKRKKFAAYREKLSDADGRRRQLAAAADIDVPALARLDQAVRDAAAQPWLAGRQDAATEGASPRSTWIVAGVAAVLVLLLAALVHPAALLFLLAVGGWVVYRSRSGARPAGKSPTAHGEVQAALARAQQSWRAAVQGFGVSTVEEAAALRGRYDEAANDAREAQRVLEALGDEATVESEWKRVGMELDKKRIHVERLLDKDVALRTLRTPEARSQHFAQLQRQAANLKDSIATLNDDERRVALELYAQGGTTRTLPCSSCTSRNCGRRLHGSNRR